MSVAILPKEPQGDLQGRLDSVAAGVGTNVSECCMRPVRQIIDLGRASSFVDRSPTIAASEGVNAVSVAFFPGEPWAIRMEKRTATNAVSWSELRRALPFFPESHGRSAWHNEKQ